MQTLKHIRAIFLLPVMVTIVIPGIIIYLVGSVNVGWSLPPPLNLVPSFLGLLFICAGLVLLVKTIS
jgi:hypothetical protein